MLFRSGRILIMDLAGKGSVCTVPTKFLIAMEKNAL